MGWGGGEGMDGFDASIAVNALAHVYCNLTRASCRKLSLTAALPGLSQSLCCAPGGVRAYIASATGSPSATTTTSSGWLIARQRVHRTSILFIYSITRAAKAPSSHVKCRFQGFY
jgi:hypothetical protein